MAPFDQFARNHHQRLFLAEIGIAEHVVFIVRQPVFELQISAQVIDQLHQRFGGYGDAREAVALDEKRRDRLFALVLDLADLPVRALRKPTGFVRHHLHGFFSRLTSRRKARNAAARSSSLRDLVWRSGGMRPARKYMISESACSTFANCSSTSSEGLRRSCSRSTRYGIEIGEPSAFLIRATTSRPLMPSSRRRSAINC